MLERGRRKLEWRKAPFGEWQSQPRFLLCGLIDLPKSRSRRLDKLAEGLFHPSELRWPRENQQAPKIAVTW